VTTAIRGIGVLALALSTIFTRISEADEEWGRNPFTFGRSAETTVKKGAAKPADSGLSVEMVLIHDGKQVAVVNGRKVGVNDTVDGAIVTGISMDSVSFVKNGKTVVRNVGDNPDETN
jgi:hypothetical protein